MHKMWHSSLHNSPIEYIKIKRNLFIVTWPLTCMYLYGSQSSCHNGYCSFYFKYVRICIWSEARTRQVLPSITTLLVRTLSLRNCPSICLILFHYIYIYIYILCHCHPQCWVWFSSSIINLLQRLSKSPNILFKVFLWRIFLTRGDRSGPDCCVFPSRSINVRPACWK